MAHRPSTSPDRGDARTAGSAGWLRPHLGTTTRDLHAPRAYMIALRHILDALDADTAWQDWWCRSGLQRCELGVVAGRLDRLRPSADIRQITDRVRANFTCAPPAHAERPAELLPLAVEDVRGMFEVIREAIGLRALPPVPELPALPPDAREVELTTRALPRDASLQRDQAYVTLAQIQEFFA